MQKALTQMNIQFANVFSDVSGVTGQAIMKAILAGERDPTNWLRFRNRRVKASEEEIARSLEGNWQEDVLFLLQQEQDGYEFCQKQMSRMRSATAAVFAQTVRTGSRGPLCQKKSARNGSRRKRRE